MKPHNRSIGGPCWGTKNSNKYHYPTCKSAQRIKPANLVRFKSPEEARKAGYVPCRVEVSTLDQ